MKCGLEIHQRLASKKLFCNCPSELAEGKDPVVTVDRRLHPVFSELGEIDRASLAEFKKSKVFEYQAFTESNCLIELDEEPPFPLNREALMIALEIAVQFNSRIVDEVHIMRKIVIDGSNTTGFQRTAVIAFSGELETSKGKIGIPLVALEEESSGIVETKKEKTIYRLDRLGIPLVEITTTPDIKDGKHLREVAEKIGLILRATGKVARGLGTVRQDVNISTEEGARVELKGAQDLKMLPALIEYEVKRQEKLVELIKELKKRKAYPVKSKTVDLTGIFKNTDSKLVKKELELGGIVLGLRLAGHAGMLGAELQAGKRYGTELSNYAKHARVRGIMHSDEDLKKIYKFSEKEISEVKKKLSIDENDSFVIVVAPENKAKDALEKVLERANMDYIPEETRKVNPDGTTSYMRPLPGRARMYPETDIPPVRIDEKLMGETKGGMAESYEDKKKFLENILNKEMAGRMLRSRHLKLFEKLVNEGIDPMLAATTIENTIVSLRREGFEITDISVLSELFEEYKKGKFVKTAIPEILKKMSKGKSVSEVLKDGKLKKITGKELEKIAKENGFDIKKIMSKYRLQVDPEELMRIIEK